MSNIQLLPSVPNPGYYNQCSGALSMTLPQETINLIKSPSFEIYSSARWTAQTNWEIELHTGATVNPVTSYIVTGTKSHAGASSLYSRTISSNHVKLITYSSIPVTSGYYAWSFYIYGDVRSNGRLYTSTIRDSSTSAILASKQFALIENQWNRIELVWYSTSSISITVGIEKDAVSGSFAGGDCWIDACQFEKLQVKNITGSTIGLRATTYFDGSTSGLYGSNASTLEYTWRGLPHQSESIRSGQTNHGGRIINLQDECALEIISINEAGINQPTNHDGIFNTADGGQLVDIINSKRTITMIGRISGTDKSDFAQKVAQLTAYFSRDTSTMRSPRRFIFQHKDGRDNIGVELTFFAAFESGLNVTLSDVYVANVEISLAMYDPYFYGHDESIDLNKENLRTIFNDNISIQRTLFSFSPYIQDMYDENASYNTTWKREGVNKDITFNNSIFCMAQDRDGMLWIGGSFTTIDSTTYNRIAMYNPQTKALTQVISGVTNGVNGIVRDIQVSPDNKIWVAGSFTSAGSVTNTAYIAYYDKTLNTFVAPTASQPNAVVNTIAINPLLYSGRYEVMIGGAFTTIGVATLNRLARLSSSTLSSSWGPVGGGVNNTVNAILFDTKSNTYYIGGEFSSILSPTVVVNKVAKYNAISGLTSIGFGFFDTVGSSGAVQSIIDDSDGNIIFAVSNTGNVQIRATGATSGVTSSNYLAYFNGSSLRWWQSDSTVYLSSPGTLFKYKGGIAFSGSNSWYWPGSATTATTFIQYNQHVGFGYTALGGTSGQKSGNVVFVSPDNVMYVAAGDPGLGTTNSRFFHASIIKSVCSSTVASKPTFQAIGNNNFSLWHIKNWISDKTVAIISKTQIMPFVYESNFASLDDYIEIDFKTVNIATYYLRNTLPSIYSWSDILAFDIQPGDVYLSVYDYNQSFVDFPSVPSVGVQQYSMFWKQTFQSIFDGINKL